MEWQVTVVSTYWVKAETAAQARKKFTDSYILGDLEDDTDIETDAYHIEINGE